VSTNNGFTAGTSPLAFTLRGTQYNGLAIEDARLTSTGSTSVAFTNTHSSDNFVTWALAFSEGSGGSSQSPLLYNRRNVLYFI
jgi:hypothetical protein